MLQGENNNYTERTETWTSETTETETIISSDGHVSQTTRTAKSSSQSKALVIQIVRAFEMTSQEDDSYVQISTDASNSKSFQKTETDKSRSSTWNSRIQVPLTNEPPRLFVEIMKKKTMTDEVIAFATIPIIQFVQAPSGTFNGGFPVYSVDGKETGKIHLQVYTQGFDTSPAEQNIDFQRLQMSIGQSFSDDEVHHQRLKEIHHKDIKMNSLVAGLGAATLLGIGAAAYGVHEHNKHKKEEQEARDQAEQEKARKEREEQERSEKERLEHDREGTERESREREERERIELKKREEHRGSGEEHKDKECRKDKDSKKDKGCKKKDCHKKDCQKKKHNRRDSDSSSSGSDSDSNSDSGSGSGSGSGSDSDDGQGAKKWKLHAHYKVGQKVKYQGKKYKCQQEHTADAANWDPKDAPALWERA